MVILWSGISARTGGGDSSLVWSVDTDINVLPHIRHVRLVSEDEVVIHRFRKISDIEDDDTFFFNHHKTVTSPSNRWDVLSSVLSDTSLVI